MANQWFFSVSVLPTEFSDCIFLCQFLSIDGKWTKQKHPNSNSNLDFSYGWLKIEHFWVCSLFSAYIVPILYLFLAISLYRPACVVNEWVIEITMMLSSMLYYSFVNILDTVMLCYSTKKILQTAALLWLFWTCFSHLTRDQNLFKMIINQTDYVFIYCNECICTVDNGM